MADIMTGVGNLFSGSSQLLNTLFGQDASVAQRGTSTTEGTATSRTEQAGQQTTRSTQDILANIIENLVRSSARTEEGTAAGEEEKSEFSQLFAGEDIGQLREFLQTLMQGSATDAQRFSPDAAIRDSSGLVTRLSRQLQEQVLPGLVNQEALAGGYNSTALKQLANDAVARTAEAGASIQLQTVADYNQQRLASLAPVLNAFQLLRGAEASTTAAGKTTSTTKGTSSEQSSQQSQQTQQTQQTGESQVEQENVTDTVQTQESETETTGRTNQDQEGILESLGGILGF